MNGARKHRVGVNLLWLVPGVVGGSEEYMTRLLEGVARRRPVDLDLTLFVLSPFAEAHSGLADAFPAVVCPIDGRRKAVRVAAENTWLARQTQRRRLDLVHHAGGVMPAVRTTPAMLTIHDLQPLVKPQHFGRTKSTYLRVMLPRSARHARLVATPSEHVVRSVVEHLGVPTDRVVTVPPVIPAAGAGDRAAVERVRRTYDLTGPYFLYPAITYPHKNHPLLVDAFADLAAGRDDVVLVLTGGPAQGEGDLRAAIDDRGITERVRRPGRVPWTDLDALYEGATALTFPSCFEGFGAPVVEAMARSCPVLAADSTALTEVVGGAGVLLPPDDAAAWTAAMTAVLDDPGHRERLRQAGLARAADFGWDRGPAALEQAYRRSLVPTPRRTTTR